MSLETWLAQYGPWCLIVVLVLLGITELVPKWLRIRDAKRYAATLKTPEERLAFWRRFKP